MGVRAVETGDRVTGSSIVRRTRIPEAGASCCAFQRDGTGICLPRPALWVVGFGGGTLPPPFTLPPHHLTRGKGEGLSPLPVSDGLRSAYGFPKKAFIIPLRMGRGSPRFSAASV